MYTSAVVVCCVVLFVCFPPPPRQNMVDAHARREVKGHLPAEGLSFRDFIPSDAQIFVDGLFDTFSKVILLSAYCH